ncbi:hypothetical protein RRG08_001936 [Elysia crispata]|uniref:Uncharacterized protein n=1 Tax=Elysia crispata TaxID=231223 RepID=A0AAE1BAG8_9GAST|nr:hypothetical protein RRG08_001936 [Elysia crispata]
MRSENFHEPHVLRCNTWKLGILCRASSVRTIEYQMSSTIAHCLTQRDPNSNERGRHLYCSKRGAKKKQRSLFLIG